MNHPHTSSRFDALTRHQISEITRHTRAFNNKGWVLATSGNFSVRLPDDISGEFAITRTGIHKGDLAETAIDRQWSRRCADGRRLTPEEPSSSSDTDIHVQLYRSIPDAAAIYHAHLLDATASARAFFQRDTETTPQDPATLQFCWCDTIKAFGDWYEWRRGESVPCAILPNGSAADTADWIQRMPDSAIQRPAADVLPGLNVIDHGIYVWGADPAETRRHLEAFAYLFSLKLESTD